VRLALEDRASGEREGGVPGDTSTLLAERERRDVARLGGKSAGNLSEKEWTKGGKGAIRPHRRKREGGGKKEVPRMLIGNGRDALVAAVVNGCRSGEKRCPRRTERKSSRRSLGKKKCARGGGKREQSSRGGKKKKKGGGGHFVLGDFRKKLVSYECLARTRAEMIGRKRGKENREAQS